MASSAPTSPALENPSPAVPPAEAASRPLQRIGKYEVLRKLGNGATSEVFLCHDEFANRDVAVKVVYQDKLNDTEQKGRVYRKLFVTEASLAGRLSHPHIVQIFDAVVGDQQSYIVMEYVTNGTLEQFCEQDKLLPVDKVVEIIFKCTRALAFAHKQGVTHRDIKPANILSSGGTDIKISDFGSAILNSGDTTLVVGIGSPAYMSPQQIKEQPLDHRTDIYSLGVVMYQLLAGTLPFNATNNFSMMYQITTAEPQPPSAHRPDIPPALDIIVKRAMQKDIDRRYQSWDEFAHDLAEAFRAEHLARRQEVADTEKFDTLRAMGFFKEFADAELWEVMRISQWQDMQPGMQIMREGEEGDFFCILAAGAVQVTRQERLLTILEAGECFGEMAYLSRASNQRTADVKAMNLARVISIRCDRLAEASDACRHRFDRAFMDILVGRLSAANVRLTAA
ncbi:MAG TPA: serine/threonine-protein kinase [Burkholderiales bacterium]|nr:serine/threonine-protein kinase [Burkholderiales bacterium]